MTQIWHTAVGAGALAASLLVGMVAAAEERLIHVPAARPLDAIRLADGRALQVIDGDSLMVDGVEWRLRGYDTPEIERAQCEGERRLGLLARARLDALLRGGGAVEIIDGGERDRHKRPLGDLVIAGRNVRGSLIAEGYARAYNGGRKKGWCSRDSRDDLVPGPLPARASR